MHLYRYQLKVAGIGETELAKLTLSVAVKLVTVAGVKTTLMGQLPPAGIDVQELVSGKAVGLAPWMVIAETCTAFSPTFERVTTCAGLDVPAVWVPKAKVAGDKLTIVQVPVRGIVCGLPDRIIRYDNRAGDGPVRCGIERNRDCATGASCKSRLTIVRLRVVSALSNTGDSKAGSTGVR